MHLSLSPATLLSLKLFYFCHSSQDIIFLLSVLSFYPNFTLINLILIPSKSQIKSSLSIILILYVSIIFHHKIVDDYQKEFNFLMENDDFNKFNTYANKILAD
jgi:hypothetical protein